MTETSKKVLLSGIQSTGRPHIGNYFGAMKQYVDLQDKYDAKIFIADLHALTTVQNKEELSKNTLDLAIDYLAIGLDPKKVTIFKQSDLPEVTELAWIFNCITTVPYLMRAHSFKDAEAKNKDINVGLFDYPMLMAADILIHNSDIVPVGKDQKQHLEIARDTAEKFNRVFGKEIFKMPEPYITEGVGTVPGIDGQKMSKSYNNHIPLFSTDEEIKKLVMSIVTDSGAGVPTNVYNMHRLFRDEEYLAKLYKEHEGKYKALKEALIDDMIAFIAPLRARREEIAKNPDYVKEMLKNNAKKLKIEVDAMMQKVREAVGI
jgi:tryptophanyl-tRNA synthetase